jgi:hypothetical protein
MGAARPAQPGEALPLSGATLPQFARIARGSVRRPIVGLWQAHALSQPRPKAQPSKSPAAWAVAVAMFQRETLAVSSMT